MGGPLGPNVLITGTPGTGKTCTSQQIAVGVIWWFICGVAALAVVGNSSRTIPVAHHVITGDLLLL